MTTPKAFLQTRIARRVFALFFLCAVVPTVALAASGYWLVTQQLRTQARGQLAQVSKVSGTLLLARLHAADEELAADAEGMGGGATPVSHRLPDLSHRFRDLLVVAEGQALPGTDDSAGRALAIKIRQSAVREQLALGRPSIVVTRLGGTPAIFLVRRIPGGRPDSATVWGRISPDYLWSDRENEELVPDGIEFCVRAPYLDQPIYCSPGAVGALPSMVTGSSTIFLGFEFASDPWTIALEQPIAMLSAPKDFRRSVILTLMLGLWLVVLASNVLLRHQLDPVARLKEGTRRLAAGDFSVAVEVSTDDEFEDLAGSFNSMARGLRDQFELLDTLREVDRHALGTRVVAQIVGPMLKRMPRLIACGRVTIAVARRGLDSSLLSVWTMENGMLEESACEVATVSLDRLAEQPDSWNFAAATASPELMEPLGITADSDVLILPLLDHGTSLGALVLHALPGELLFPATAVHRARQVADQVALALANCLLVDRLNAQSVGTLETLGRAIDASSPWTAGHSGRVTSVAVAIGRQMALSAELLERLNRGGLLHDIGKIGIPTAVLDKPGKLDPAELEQIRAHPVLGARILEPIQAFDDVIGIVRHHHERFDGTGYPDRLAGTNIPFLARVLSVADVYDALVSDRPYRRGWTSDAAIAYITERARVEFDPEVVAGFIALVGGAEWMVEDSMVEAANAAVAEVTA